MSDLLDRLSLGAAQAKTLNRDPTAKMMLEAVEAIEMREARIAELADALRDIVGLSDTRKQWELIEVKQIIAKARSALASEGPPAVAAPRPSEDEIASVLHTQYRGLMRT